MPTCVHCDNQCGHLCPHVYTVTTNVVTYAHMFMYMQMLYVSAMLSVVADKYL